jgi:DNA-binding protein HU-beta
LGTPVLHAQAGALIDRTNVEPRWSEDRAAYSFLHGLAYADRSRSEPMNKTDLVAALSDRTELSRTDAGRFFDALFDADSGIIAETLKRGDKVQISGFGTFEARKRAGRSGRNPRTGEEIHIPATRTAAFRPGKALKDAMNGQS